MLIFYIIPDIHIDTRLYERTNSSHPIESWLNTLPRRIEKPRVGFKSITNIPALVFPVVFVEALPLRQPLHNY